MRKRSALIDRVVHRRGLRRWVRAARRAHTMPLAALQQERAMAGQLLYALSEMTMIADSRLTLPLAGADVAPAPHGADWIWRPALWQLALSAPGIVSPVNNARLGDELTIFHDCTRSELILRQIRNRGAADLAPYGLRIDVFAFEGAFLSLVLDLPETAVIGLRRDQLLRLNLIAELEKPREIFARLNIKHGPDTEQLVRILPLQQEGGMVEFDLATAKLNEKRISRAWVDLIFEDPGMSQIILRDLTFSRLPRAEF